MLPESLSFVTLTIKRRISLSINKKMSKKFFCLLCLFFFSLFLKAAMINQDSALIKKCSDFELSGKGLSDQWNKSEWIVLKGREKAESSYSTRVKILYSQKGIYFLFDCKDKKIVSSMKSDNLHLWEEDVVEVFLWTDEKFPVYFEYELSPFNYELPIMVPNNKGKFLGWLPWDYVGDRKTRHATSVTGGELVNGGSISGWMAEIFIPFKLLTPLSNVPPESGSRWRANMYRIDYDSGTEIPFEWQKTSQTFHEYEKFGTFIFE
jgi:hypothetical protein